MSTAARSREGPGQRFAFPNIDNYQLLPYSETVPPAARGVPIIFMKRGYDHGQDRISRRPGCPEAA